jgi:hypothetical protein
VRYLSNSKVLRAEVEKTSEIFGRLRQCHYHVGRENIVKAEKDDDAQPLRRK